ncbi:MAG: hypothetical protein HY321_01585 [Armatimonadetes bacterium]|nr:hypothetical protein [Armatimonadota bacterium]
MTSMWRRLVVLSVFVCALYIVGLATVGRADGEKLAEKQCGDVTFWVERLGSDNDGFNLLVKYEGEGEKKCEDVKVTLTMNDGSTKEFRYSGPVRKTNRSSFGGESGLKPAPIKAAEISCGSSCK